MAQEPSSNMYFADDGGVHIPAGKLEYPQGTPITASGDEINSAADLSAQTDTMSASTVMDATVASYTSGVVRHGPIIETTIYIDLTGAKSTTTDLDIIGDTGACHVGQVTAAINGTVFAGEIHCAEVPTTGADDIDLYSATEGTGAYDAGIATLTETALVTSGGAHAIGTVKPFTALPAADEYLYLTCGEAGTVGTYDAGILVIKLWGLAA